MSKLWKYKCLKCKHTWHNKGRNISNAKCPECGAFVGSDNFSDEW